MSIFSSFLSLLLLFLLTTHFSFSQGYENATLSHCPTKCGPLEISYPFGIGDGCFLPGFELICNHSIPYLYNSSIQLLDIFKDHVRVNSTAFIATYCPTSDDDTRDALLELDEESPFTVSVDSNKLMTIGCNSAGFVTDGASTLSACFSHCFAGEPIDNGSCSGKGCCETFVPSLKKTMSVQVEEGLTGDSRFNDSLCSYGFVVEVRSYTFVESDLRKFNETADIAMRLDWAIAEKNCEKAVGKVGYACGENSVCVNSITGFGYLCKCADGFSGNSYLNGSKGCQDIDECEKSSLYCVAGATCKNKVPTFECVCPAGSTGNGLIRGSGCTKIFPIIRVVFGAGLSILILLSGGTWLYWALKRRKLIKLREKFFRENGGLLLQAQVGSSDGSRIESSRIFTSEELEKATNNYDDSRIIGKGGYGTVYKGILEDLRVVAIKRSRLMDKSQIQQFVNEVVILTQINHRNVVKLLGCCLETEVPLLVYEYVTNGTLHHHIHTNNNYRKPILWEDRLRIATETAEALAYLHSSVCIPIFHRDVKSSNILLDEKYTAKVSDFGVSRLVPLDQNQITTLVQGTLGYLDPEYFQTSQLTAKSDVYSFGVVLVELLTGQKPVSLERSEEGTNLAMYFLSAIRTNKLTEILDVQFLREDIMDEVRAVAKLAMRCLRLKGQKRPTMKEVAQELASLRESHKHSQEDMMCSVDVEPANQDGWSKDDIHSDVFPSEMGR